MMKFRHFLFVGMFFSYVAGPASPAHAMSLLEFFFPMLKPPGPAKTLRAPFADEDAVVLELDAMGNKENQTPLHMRHRTNERMTLWVQHNIPVMMNYSAPNYEAEYSDKISNFSEIGKKEYNQFLQDSSILKTLSTGGYDVSGFIKEYPVILNQGPVENRYKWVYQMDIMVTYMKTGVKNLAALEPGQVISKDYTITFQLGRSRDAQNDAGIFIETWNAVLKK